jgi:hypothetical protein
VTESVRVAQATRLGFAIAKREVDPEIDGEADEEHSEGHGDQVQVPDGHGCESGGAGQTHGEREKRGEDQAQ